MRPQGKLESVVNGAGREPSEDAVRKERVNPDGTDRQSKETNRKGKGRVGQKKSRQLVRKKETTTTPHEIYIKLIRIITEMETIYSGPVRYNGKSVMNWGSEPLSMKMKIWVVL